MALDRQSIEKKDFPIGRRGYDPDAVDAHLAVLAEEVDQLQRSKRASRTDTLAQVASEQVRAIVEAAETSAQDITREAEQDARRIRQDAERDAEEARSTAGQQARDHLDRVSQAASAMLARVDAMESELTTLVDGLRTGANRVTADLSLLQNTLGELRASARPAAADEVSAPPAPAAAAAAAPVVHEAVPAEESFEPEEDFAAAEPATVDEPAGDDTESARLVALNMALNGTPRDEADRYLAQHFNLDDRSSLLDDVYARVG